MADLQNDGQVFPAAPTIANLQKRGMIFLGDGEFEKAKEYFDRVLDIDPENGDAYLGMMLACNKCTCKEAFEVVFDLPPELLDVKSIERAKRYATEETRQWFDSLNDIKAQLEARIKKHSEEQAEVLAPIRAKLAKAEGLLCASTGRTFAVCSSGQVLFTGKEDDTKLFTLKRRVGNLQNVVALSASLVKAAALKADGTVEVFGFHAYDEQKTYTVQDAVAIATTNNNVFVLRSNGTVEVIGMANIYKIRETVVAWTDIAAISASNKHIVGLKKDGTVVAAGENSYGECNVSEWTDIVAVSAAGWHTVGLKADGTVVSAGTFTMNYGMVYDWTDIVAVAAGTHCTVGLKADGTVVATPQKNKSSTQSDVSEWRDVIAISVGDSHTVGLKKDGTLVSTPYNYFGQANVSDWKLFDDFDNLEEERKVAFERRKAEFEEEKKREAEELARKIAPIQARIDDLKRQSSELYEKKVNLKGLFAASKRKEIELKLDAIYEEEIKLNRQIRNLKGEL